MAEAESKVPVKTEEKASERATALEARRPLETLRGEIDRLFDNFGREFWRFPFRRPTFAMEPFWRREVAWGAAPAVDVVEKEKAYELTAELPGIDEKNIEVKLANGCLRIKGEKQKEKEEKKRTTTSMNAALALLSAASPCRKASTVTRSRQASRRTSSR